MSLCLAVSVPGTVCASDLPEFTSAILLHSADGQTTEEAVDTTEDAVNQKEDQKTSTEKKEDKIAQPDSGARSLDAQLQGIEDAVAKAVKEKNPDMTSGVMKDFLEASNTYDTLSDSKKDELSAQTKKDIETVRSRIADKIHTADGVTVDSPDWYAKTEVAESSHTQDVLKAASVQYAGSTPQLIYGKDITFTDIRSDASYRQKTAVSFGFPVPKGYDQLKNPQIVRYADGKLVEIEPERKGDTFYVDMVYPLENIFILDTPVALTGISMEQKVSINVGQKQKLQVTLVPASTTQEYQLEWKSQNPQIATVDTSGTVTAKKEGTTVITATVKGTQITASCSVTVVQGAHALTTSMATVMQQIRNYMQSVDKNPTLGSEWFVLGLARSGVDTNSTYFKTYYNHIANYLKENKGKLTSGVKYTEYSKMILIMTSMGKDARSIAGYNLFEPLADFETVTGQGTNGPIWALIALNSNPAYSIPQVKGVKVQTTEQKLIDYLLDKEIKEGGWSMSGDVADSDLTGMALQALAPYYQVKGYEKVTAAVDRALDVLSSMQNQTGGYSTMGVETSESAAQVLTGLCALDIDPMQDERFVKGGSWIVENLITYHIAGSGFMHVKAGAGNNGGGEAGKVNGMATEQGYYALTTYQRLLDKKTSLYDMSDIKLTKGEAGDGKGTGLENKDDTKTDNKGTTDTKKDTTTKKNTTTTKKKLTYKGKRLTLSSGSGKKLSLTGSAAKKLTLNSGTAADTENSGDGWNFAPEDYVEDEDSSKKLTLADASADNAEESSAVTETEDTDTQMQQGAAAARTGIGEASRSHSVGLFLGGVAAGILVTVGGVWLYLKKKRR